MSDPVPCPDCGCKKIRGAHYGSFEACNRIKNLKAEVERLHVEISNMASPQALANALDKVRLADQELDRRGAEIERLLADRDQLRQDRDLFSENLGEAEARLARVTEAGRRLDLALPDHAPARWGGALNLFGKILAAIRRWFGNQPMDVGYFHAAGPTYGDHIAALPRGTRLAHCQIEWGGVTTAARYASEMQSRGMRAVYALSGDIWLRSGSVWSLAPNWQQVLTTQDLPQIAEFSRRKALHSLYIADEPQNYGIPVSELATVNAWLQARGYRTMVVEGGWVAPEHPPYDYYGLTYYGGRPDGSWGADWAQVRRIYSRSRANLMVGFSFQEKPHAIRLSDVQESWKVAQEIKAKVLLWFVWSSVGSGVGVDVSPQIARYQERLMYEVPPWRPNEGRA